MVTETIIEEESGSAEVIVEEFSGEVTESEELSVVEFSGTEPSSSYKKHMRRVRSSTVNSDISYVSC